MARRLSNENRLMEVRDNLSNSTLGIYYRMPTKSEREGYMAARSHRNKNGKIIQTPVEAQLEYGPRIITGIRFGDFENKNGNLISSDLKHPDYHPDWKEDLEENASDVVQYVAFMVFDNPVGSVDVGPVAEKAPDKDDDREDDDNAEKKSRKR